MTRGQQVEAAAIPAAEEAWRAAIEHAAGCLACRTPGGVCSKGERLLGTYEDKVRQARSEGDAA
ncbi:hypothetical protein ACPEIC_13830 [Stenotrophomonas sp. NPDC087984]